nr:MAG TPA: hypothetical protein [Caudoviricetes sp.]
MTLEEAIKHTLEVADQAPCDRCREEHLQLAEWLKELQMFRKEGGNKNG